MRERIEQRVFLAKGGYEYNEREISPLDPQEIENFALSLVDLYHEEKLKVMNVVVSGVFAHIKKDQEE